MGEFAFAIRLNHLLTKDEILREYFDRVSYGYLTRGITSGSMAYYGRLPRDLTEAQQIALMVNAKNPITLDPIHSPERFRTEFEGMVTRLVTAGVLGEEEAQTVRVETLHFQTPAAPVLPYIASYLTPSIRAAQAHDPHLATYPTTLDATMSEQIERLAQDTIEDLAWRHVSDYAIIIIDRETMELRVMLGGIHSDADAGQVNGALAPRQPGSTIKPFTYLLAFERLAMTPESTVLDLPVRFDTAEHTSYEPRDYAQKFEGAVSVAEALSQSLNVPAVRTLQSLGTSVLLDFLRGVGITTLTESADHYGLALTLGVGEVNLYELTRAFSIFAHSGNLCGVRVRTSDPMDCHSVAESGAIDEVNSILTSRSYKLGGFPLHSALDFADRHVFVKTGTSRNFRDNWAIGYTDHAIIGVWAGNKDGSDMQGVSGATGAGEIFRKVVEYREPTSEDTALTTAPPGRDPYIEITAPLSGSVFRVGTLRETAGIGCTISTNIPYDTLVRKLDGQDLKTPTITPTVGSHALDVWLLRDGEIVGTGSSTFEVRGE